MNLLYTVIAYESIDPANVARALGDGYEKHALHGPRTIDGILCLDKYVLAWQDEESGNYDLVWSPNAKPRVYNLGNDSLMFWYFLFYRWMSQAWCWPIRIQDYGPEKMGGDESK